MSDLPKLEMRFKKLKVTKSIKEIFLMYKIESKVIFKVVGNNKIGNHSIQFKIK